MSKNEISDEYLSNIAEIFDLVHEKTLSKTLRWEQTVDSDVFQTSLKKYTILLYSFDKICSQEKPFIQIVNWKGDVIETITPLFLAGYIDDLERKIFDLNYWSRQTALDIDKSLKEVLSELKGETDSGTL